MNQHRRFEVNDRPPPRLGALTYKPGTLGVALEKFKADGVKVLDFWRSGGRWVFKTMEPR